MISATVEAADHLPLTVPRLLRARAQRYDDKVFIVCDDRTLTYRDAEQQSRELARALLAAGFGKGTHIGLLHPNGTEFAVAWLAAARIGAVAIPFSTFSTPAELAGMIRGADVEVLLAAASYRSHDYGQTLRIAVPELDLDSAPPLWSTSIPSLRHVHLSSSSNTIGRAWTIDGLLDGADLIDDDVLEAVEADVSPADPMVIVHTSGSTSAPKGVVHAHGPLIRHQNNLNLVRSYEDIDVLFANSPWFWIGGFAFGLLATLVAGGRLVCSNAPDAAGVLDVLDRERPTVANGFAQTVAHLPQDPSFAARDLSSIRRGNLYPIMPDDVRPEDPGLRHGMLGMTEAGSVCLLSADEHDLPERQRGSFGAPAPGFETRVLDPDTGEARPTGVVGVLWLRGPFLMEGYYGRERSDAFDADGWYCTGDLFHVDAEGLHYFHGRHGDMIKTGGANVSPREVESVIADRAGLRAHVIGLDDEKRGQIVAAAVVSDEPVDLDALTTTLKGELSSYKVPKVVIVLAEAAVPMMSSGKLDARALRALFHDR